MVYQHAEECPDNYAWLNIPHGSIGLPVLYVFANKAINLRNKFAKEAVRELVFLQCRIEQQPHKTDILLVVVHRLESDVVEDPKIVLCANRFLKHCIAFPRELVESVLTRFAVKDR